MSEQQPAIPMNRSRLDAPTGIDLTANESAPLQEAAKPASKALQTLKWAFSFPAMLGAGLVGRVFYEARTFFIDPDLWWHIKVGQDLMRTHHFPTTDPYSWTVAGQPWMAYEWLGDAAIGFVGKFGPQALNALLIGLSSVIMLTLYYYASFCARNAKAGFVSALLLCSFAFANFHLRPQMFGFLFLILTLIMLERFRQGCSRSLWFLPPLFLVWINTHGSWVVGMGVIMLSIVCGLFSFRIGSVESVAWTEKQRTQLELALLASIAVIPFTPYGTRLAAYPFLVASSLPLNVRYVLEWQPMPFNIWWGQMFLVVLAGAFALQEMYHFNFRLQEWVLGLGGIVMVCLHVRFVLVFVPFFAPILATMLARWIPGYKREKDKFVLNGVLMAGVVFGMVWYFPTRSKLEQRIKEEFPVRAVNFLHSHPVQGPLFDNYGYGGYLIANLPEYKVFIDGRGDLYELGGTFADYLTVATLKPSAFSVLRSYGIRTCLLERNEPLAVVLAVHPDWKQIYSDDASVIFVRRDSQDVAADVGGWRAAGRSERESRAD